MGQGRNAVYLASKGWKVTGIDISDEGVRIARETAAKQKLALDAIETDSDTWDFGTSRWALVTMIYSGADVPTVERVKTSLRRGGLFVVEVFHRTARAAPEAAASRPDSSPRSSRTASRSSTTRSSRTVPTGEARAR
jgi:SAM-dependent methyltransferase